MSKPLWENIMDNRSVFNVNQYDENIRKVIPYYDEMYDDIFGLIKAYCGNRPLSILDTGCGTGNFGLKAYDILSI